MTKIVLPHWINKHIDLKLPFTEGSLYDFLLELVNLNPSIERYIFSKENNSLKAVSSTALWLNEKEIPSQLDEWKLLKFGVNDTLSIEPAIVGG